MECCVGVSTEIVLKIDDITRWREHNYFIFELKKKTFQGWTQQTSEIFFPREDKLHMFKPTCNFLFTT